jgi:MFS family permease
LALTVYWLGNTLMWGALLHLGLQSRLSDWFGQDRVGYYLGVLGFAGGVVGTVVQIVAGAFSDRSAHPAGRRRPYVVVGTLLGAAALVALGAAPSFWYFAGALLLVQLFTNVALGPFTALLPDTVNPREHGKASGFMGIARLLGDTGGLILAGQMLSTGALVGAPLALIVAFHDRRMFLMCALMAAFLVLGMVYTCRAILETPLRRPPAEPVLQIVRRSFRVNLRDHPDFYWLLLSRAVTNLGFYTFLEVLFYYLKYTLRVPDPEQTSVLVMLPAIGAALLSSLPAGLLSDRLGRKRLIIFAQLLMAAGAGAFMLGGGLATAYAGAIPAGLAYGVFTAVEWALACNLLPREESARYLGLWNVSAIVPQIIAFPVAGALGSALSAVQPGLGWRVDFGLALVCCLGGLYFLRFVRERRAAPDSHSGCHAQ